MLTVVDSDGCVASTYVEVKHPEGLYFNALHHYFLTFGFEVVDFVVTSTNVKCHGSTDGSMSIFAKGI